MMENLFSRSAILLGEESIEVLKGSHVMLFGTGGVGSYAAEGLARLGIGAITLVDNDDVSVSNRNRQLPALSSTVGRKKVEVVADRIRDINPDCRVTAIDAFYLPESPVEIPDDVGLVLDAVDTVAAKVDIIRVCHERSIPVLSCMGMGNRTDPGSIRIGDLFETSGDPLCRVMRQQLRKLGIQSLPVVYSTQPPVSLKGPAEVKDNGRPVPGSLPFVPSVAGLFMAYYAAKVLTDMEG